VASVHACERQLVIFQVRLQLPLQQLFCARLRNTEQAIPLIFLIPVQQIAIGLTFSPVLEYCSCVWHHNITNKLSLQIELIQKRAIRIIFECTRGMPYRSALHCAALSSLHTRRIDQARQIFQSIMQPDSCIHALLPPARDPNLVSRLRHARTLQVPSNRTKKYQSFLDYGLLHYQ